MEEVVRVFVNVIVVMGMFAALMLPILAVPYLFIKMGSVAGKVQAKMSGATKSAAKNSAPGQALAQRRQIRNKVQAERGRRMLGRSGSVIGGGVRKDSRAEFATFKAGEDKKEVARHADAMRSDSGAKLFKTATTSKNRNEREAAMQVIARSGYDTQLNALHDLYNSNTGTQKSDSVGAAAWKQTTVDNFGTIKKEAPKAVGKTYASLSQEAILDMGTDSFAEAMADPVARTTFTDAMANPQLQGRIKQVHTNYHTTGTLPIRKAPDVE